MANNSSANESGGNQTVSITVSSHSGDSIEYCIRILNYLIGSLKLQTIQPIVLMEDITIEVLLQVHCKLMGWDFAKEFIPSRSPKDDAQRIILSLKDKFGTDKFDALDAQRIVEKHPVQLRFLIENYHLIHDHQYKRSLGLGISTATDRSSSGNHLAVSQPSDTELKGADSFYIFPTPLPPQSSEGIDSESDKSEPQGEATSFLDSDFETVDDFVVNVYDSTTADDTLNDSDFDDSLVSEINAPNAVNPLYKNKTKRPLSSSPIDNKKWNQSSLITDPNVSSIRESPSKKIQRTIASTKSYNNTGRSPSRKIQPTGGSTQSYSNTGRSPPRKIQPTGGSTQSYNNTDRSPSRKIQQTGGSTQSYNNTDRSRRSTPNDKLTERSKQSSSTAGPSKHNSPASKQTSRGKSQDTEDMYDMRSIRSKKSDKRSPETFQESSTKSLSLTDLDNRTVRNKENTELPAAEVNSALALDGIRDMHQSIRKQLTESWDAIDSDIKKLKEKTSCPELKDECPPQPLPNLRWMMPVDLRFPYYPGGIIHPKCKRFSKSQIKRTQSSKPSQADFVDSNSSTAVESRGRTQFFDETDSE